MSLRLAVLQEQLEHRFVRRAHARNGATDLGKQRVLDDPFARFLVAACGGKNRSRIEIRRVSRGEVPRAATVSRSRDAVPGAVIPSRSPSIASSTMPIAIASPCSSA